MATKYYVDGNGKYLGGFDGALPPTGSVEVAFPPIDGRQTWNGSNWSAFDPSSFDTDSLNQALTEPGSVVRALGLVTFQEINKLRVKAGLTAYTMDQFITALKANMR